MSAEIYKGVAEAILHLVEKNYVVKIISHKTKFPYMGEKINLRSSAMKWVRKNLIKKKILKLIKKIFSLKIQ